MNTSSPYCFFFNCLCYFKSFNCFPAFFLFLVLSVHSYQAQKNELKKEPFLAKVFFKNGAEIYSYDNEFNKQILSDETVLNNVDISNQNSRQKYSTTIVTKNRNKLKGSLSQQLKNALELREREVISKVQNEIKKFEKQKETFVKCGFIAFPDQVYLPSTGSKFNCTLGRNGHDVFKSNIVKVYFSVNALDFLYSGIHCHYNNKPLESCYSIFFSVRPPPIIHKMFAYNYWNASIIV